MTTMKRILGAILALGIILSLGACSSSELDSPFDTAEETAETAEPAPVKTQGAQKPTKTIREEPQGTFDPTGFSVGFGRYVVTPPKGSPMAGYGNSSMRLSSETLDDLYATCVAVSDGTNTALFFSMDVINIPTSVWEKVCADIMARKG